jgi:hypothetical protein
VGEVPIVEEQWTLDDWAWVLVCWRISNQDLRRVPQRFELDCLGSCETAEAGYARRSEKTTAQQPEKRATLTGLDGHVRIIAGAGWSS